MRLRVEVDGEPLAPGAAVSGRVVVEDGGRARDALRAPGLRRAHRGLRQAPRARPARRSSPRATWPTAAVFAFQLRLPDDALPEVATAHGRIGWEVRARVDRAGSGPDRRPAHLAAAGLHCPGPGEVAEWLKALAC